MLLNFILYFTFISRVYVFNAHRELVEELHPLMKEALERRPEVYMTQLIIYAKYAQSERIYSYVRL